MKHDDNVNCGNTNRKWRSDPRSCKTIRVYLQLLKLKLPLRGSHLRSKLYFPSSHRSHLQNLSSWNLILTFSLGGSRRNSLGLSFDSFTIITRVRVGYEILRRDTRLVGYNHLISNKREWNNCFIKKAHKISRILPVLICKNNRFSACF